MGMAGECTPGHVVVRNRTALADALGGAGGRHGLVAVVGDDAEAWLGRHRGLVQGASDVGVVSIGESVRSTTAATGTEATVPEVTGVSDATDLAMLGSAVSDYVERFAEQGSRPTIVVDAVDDLVEANGLETTFRALHLLSSRVAAEDGRLLTVLPDSLRQDQAETLAALAD